MADYKESYKSSAGSNLSTAKVAKKLSYGWVVAIAGAGVLLAAGSFQYSFGVFLKPLVDKFGWSRAAISGCVSGRNIVSGVFSPIAGALITRRAEFHGLARG